MQVLLLKRKHLFFLHFFTNYCESQRTHMVFFEGPKLKFRPKRRDSLRKFHRTYGLPLENYLSDRADHYRKCPTAIGEHCKMEIESGIVIYKFMPLSIMQLLSDSVLFKCKIYYLFNYYFRIFKPVSGLVFEHTLIILFFF